MPTFFIVNKHTQRCITFGVTLRFKQSNVMIQTTIRELKEGDFFTFRPHEEPNERQVYVRSRYDRSGKKFAYFPYSDMMDEHFAKGSRVVFTDFIF